MSAVTKPSRLIRKPEVLKRTSLSNSTLYAYMAKGLFPANVKLGVRSVAWDEAAVDAWIAERLTSQTGGEAQG